MNEIYKGTSRPQTEGDIQKAANSIGVEVAAMKAVIEVESASKAFNPDGSMTMLYEPHIAYRHSSGKVRDSLVLARVAAQNWGNIPYPGRYADRYAQFLKCAQIGGLELACISCSWGLPQGMGFNHKPFGYASAEAMVRAFADNGEPEQILGMARFIAAHGTMLAALKRKDWAGFALRYNGTGYKVNRYDEKLAAAYIRHNKTTAALGRLLRVGDKGSDVKALQQMLNAVGYDLDADGHFGKITFAAITAFQRSRKLGVDGIVGPQTATALASAAKGN